MKYYKYRVVFYNDLAEEEMARDGVVCGTSFTDATGKIEEDYGENNISISLYLLTYDGEQCVELQEITGNEGEESEKDLGRV